MDRRTEVRGCGALPRSARSEGAEHRPGHARTRRTHGDGSACTWGGNGPYPRWSGGGAAVGRR
ncbi:hypothetical protein DTW94_20185 [Streptomyces cavourensis]|uniref:Uncharacterized protein n=1 Tax=Streptomyces cavourensis TaxID=67258 RepID=A0AAD0Q6K7_9ACTN|nr:hypothetical protein DTW94_20185 [Streptomyces cavourensis]